MSLRKKTLAVPLTAGVERRRGGEDLTASLTQAPAVPRAANLYRTRTGEWARRPGHTAIATETVNLDLYERPFSGFIGGASVGGEMFLATPFSLWARADGEGWSPRGVPSQSSFGARLSVLSGVLPSSEEASGVRAIASAAGGGVILSITESADAYSSGVSTVALSAVRASDGMLIQQCSYSSRLLTGQPRVRAIYSSAKDRLVVFYTTPSLPSTAATALLAVVYQPSALLGGASLSVTGDAVTLAADLIGTATSALAHFDLMVEEDTGDIVVAYRGTGGNTRALRFNPTTSAVSTGPVTVVAGGDVAANSLAWARGDVFPQATYTLVTAINSAVGVVARTITKATLAQSAATTVKASPGAVGSVVAFKDSGAGYTIGANWDVVDSTNSQRSAIWSSYFNGSWSTPAVVPDLCGCRIHGHPFLFQPAATFSRWALPVVSSIFNGGKLFFASSDAALSDRRGILLEAFDEETDTAPAADGNLMDVASYGGEYFYGCVERTGLSGKLGEASTSRAYYSTVGHIIRLSLAGHANFVHIEQDVALIPGASWSKADADVSPGAPWPPAPAPPACLLTEVAGNSPSGGLVRIRTCLVTVDAKGRRWQGPPSDEATFTLTAINKALTASFSQVISYNSGNVSLEIYRSKVLSTQFFRDNRVPYVGGSAGIGVVLNIGTVTTEAQLEQSLPLYTDGGELFHVAPPPSNVAWVAGTRLLVADAQKPGTIWASSEFTPGEGPWFHPDVAISLPTGDEIVAGAFMDGRSFIFTRKSIYALAGAWPGRTGLGQLPEAQRIAVGIGGYSQQSTLVTKEGVWFYSEDRGLCLLDRSLAVQTPGKTVDGVITSAPVAAVLAEKYDQVRFYLADGTYAAYDQVERQWSHGKVVGLGGALLTGAFVHNRDVYLYTNGSLVLKEDAAALSDNGTAFPCDIDIRVPIGAPGGKARVYRAILAGLWSGDTKLTCTIFNDFGNVGSGEETKVMTVKGKAGETTPSLYEQTIKPARGRCDGMLLRLSFQSTEPGITYRSLAVEVGTYQPATIARGGSSRQA